MAPFRILIVGASIAGPMAAYWFSKTGAEITIIERYPELRKGGQNIDIRLTGVTVMRKIPGMEEAVRATLAPEEGVSMLYPDGTPVAIMRATGNVEQQSLVSEFEIFRGDLSRVIYNLTKDKKNVRYVFGEQIASMEQGDDNTPIKVVFANGLASAEYDLVVACDGATSRTRAMGLGCGVRDHIKPVGAWVSYFSVKQDLLNGEKIGLGFSVPGGRAISIGPDSAERNRIMTWSSHESVDDAGLQEFRHAQKEGEVALKQLVLKRFQGAGWRTDEFLEALHDSDDFYASELCQVSVPSLYKGRFVLAGDAGHATGPTGTGTSLALAGAYILAGEIRRHRGDIAAGLKAYEDRMKPIIKDMQVIPPGVLSFMAPQTSWGISLRNLLFKVVCWAMHWGSTVSWLTSFWSAGLGKDKYNLPDYDWVE